MFRTEVACSFPSFWLQPECFIWLLLFKSYSVFSKFNYQLHCIKLSRLSSVLNTSPINNIHDAGESVYILYSWYDLLMEHNAHINHVWRINLVVITRSHNDAHRLTSALLSKHTDCWSWSKMGRVDSSSVPKQMRQSQSGTAYWKHWQIVQSQK